MSLISGTASDLQLLSATLRATFGAPMVVLGWILLAFDASRMGEPGWIYEPVLLLAITWFISASVTFIVALPFAVWLNSRGALGLLPLCAFGGVLGWLMFSGYGALPALADAMIFYVVCSEEGGTSGSKG